MDLKLVPDTAWHFVPIQFQGLALPLIDIKVAVTSGALPSSDVFSQVKAWLKTHLREINAGY